jgi:hypothetical protein
MATSLRRHEPGAVLGLIACGGVSGEAPEFDIVVSTKRPDPFRADLRFLNKLVWLGSMSPFQRSFFLDDDTIVLSELTPIVERVFLGRPFAFNCERVAPDRAFPGPNHLEASAVAREFSVERVMDPSGGGHLYFEQPICRPFFCEAVGLPLFEPTKYGALTGDGFVSDELALAIVAHRHKFDLPSIENFVQPLSVAMADDVQTDQSSNDYGQPASAEGRSGPRPQVVHFCADAKKSLNYETLVAHLLGDPPARDRHSLAARARGLFRSALGRDE